MNITVQTYGEHAILIAWPAVISDDTHQEILALNKKINGDFAGELIETVTTYHSIAVYLKESTSLQPSIKKLESLVSSNILETISKNRLVSIPVCYEGCFALDIALVAAKNNLTKKEVILLHTTPFYPVHFLGFLPGFPYLAGLDRKLHTPRLKAPRLQVAAGSVGIGGSQTGIYPCNSPGGWNIIGQTPLQLFDVINNPPNLLKAGDLIKFESIPLKEYKEIKQDVNAGIFQLKTESL